MNEIIISEEYNRAVALHRRISANAQSAQESLYEVCKGLKEMRDDKLYKELGYQNFEDYCKNEIGISDRMSRKYISIIENWNPGSEFASLGVTKLYLLSTLSEEERTEITEKNDIEDMTKRELEQKIAELKTRDKTIETLRSNIDLCNESTRKYKDECEQLRQKNTELEQQVEELENRPVEVAVEESHEVENMRKAMVRLNSEHDKAMTELQEENFRDIRRLSDEHNAEIKKLAAEHSAAMDKLAADFEAKLAEAKRTAPADTAPAADKKEIFKAYLSNALDSVSRLFTFVGDSADKMYIEQLMKLADMIRGRTVNINIKEN